MPVILIDLLVLHALIEGGASQSLIVDILAFAERFPLIAEPARALGITATEGIAGETREVTGAG